MAAMLLQAGEGSEWRFHLQGEPDYGVDWAQGEQIAYRRCLATSARSLASDPDDTASYLANIADIACSEPRDRFLKAMEVELRSGPPPRLSEHDIAQMLQSARNQIVAWSEGIIFAFRHQHRPD